MYAWRPCTIDSKLRRVTARSLKRMPSLEHSMSSALMMIYSKVLETGAFVALLRVPPVW